MCILFLMPLRMSEGRSQSDMKTPFLKLSLCCAVQFCVCLSLKADVQVGLRMEHDDYLQYEKMTAFITIYNDEDYKVVIDSAMTNRNDELRFRIRRNFKEDTIRINRNALIDYMELKPGEKKTLMIDLTMWYSVSPVGSYHIVAELEHGGRRWHSKGFLVNVVDGIELASAQRSIPGDPNRTRRYSLRYWAREQKEHIFLRSEEPENGIVYGVFYLGNLIRVFPPQLNVERNGGITVIHQSGRNMFTRTTFMSEPHAVKFIDQVYINENGVPYKGQ